jgi:integrase
MAQAVRESQRLVPIEKHPGIYRKGSRYQVRYRHHGRQVARSFPNLSEAKRFKGKVDAGEAQPTSRRPFNAYADEWIITYTGRTARGLSDTTRAAYKDALERFAKPFFVARPLDQIGPKLIREYIAHIEAQNVAPNSVRKYFAPVRALLATAAEDELILRNPASDMRITTADARPRMPKWMTAGQTKALLGEIPETHADLVYMLASTGLRITEALSLRWSDLTLIDGRPMLTVTRSKTAAGERTIPLTPEATRRLTARRAKAVYDRDDDLLYPARNGAVIDPRNFRRNVFRPAAQAAGVPWATPHKLRHGMASLMAAQGLGAPEIAAYLGHADGGVLALRTYIHGEPVNVDFIDGALRADSATGA